MGGHELQRAFNGVPVIEISNWWTPLTSGQGEQDEEPRSVTLISSVTSGRERRLSRCRFKETKKNVPIGTVVNIIARDPWNKAHAGPWRGSKSISLENKSRPARATARAPVSKPDTHSAKVTRDSSMIYILTANQGLQLYGCWTKVKPHPSAPAWAPMFTTPDRILRWRKTTSRKWWEKRFPF